ncbi:MAG: LysM peptidoglycan-binding domain-containing protein [Thiobacillus sp.]|nr:LysM peptidoglycan-binding domain-containing protein [Thiobacillus sp.]
MPGTCFIRSGLRPGLILLLASLGLSAQAADTQAGFQFLQWRSAPSVDAPQTGTENTVQDDVWQRIRAGFKIDDAAEQNPLVSAQTAWYAARPDYVRRIVERSRRYLYHIVQEVDRRAMPMEIALLPMIESAFNPVALSPSAASGIWQFIPSTGRLYGLKQDSWYDGRRDFTAATNAALDYLGKLYLDFGDWQLALAAYNCGEGCVARAIQKNVAQGLPTDYASLPLPAETRNYVPKLLAMKALIRSPEQFGLALDPLPNQPYFDQVTVRTASMDVQSAARLAGMSRDEFLALNAAFPKKLIRSDTPVNLLVPAGRADDFQRKLQSGDWDSWQPYSVQRGERPEAVARRLGVDLDRLQAHNQFHLKRGKFAQAQTILVPVKGRSVDAPSSQADVAVSSYIVQRGDTLFGIARNRGLTVAQIAAANPQLDGAIQPGQTLNLPDSPAAVDNSSAVSVRPVAFKPRSEKPARASVRHYKVKRGDTLHAIAQRFDVSLADLKAWNPAMRKTSTLRPGQQLTLRRP